MSAVANSGHVVCVPFPAQGHITPMLKLARLLHSKGFFITFVNTEYNHRRLLRSRGSESLHGIPTFRFESIPDGQPPLEGGDANATQDVFSLFYAVLNNCLEPFMELLQRVRDPASGSPPVTVILSDCANPFTLDAARELGVPVYMLWVFGPCSFMCFEQCGALLDKGILPLTDPSFMTDGSLDVEVDWKPSMKGMRLKDFPSFIHTITHKDHVEIPFLTTFVERCRELPTIFNTFEALDAESLKDIATTIAGPIYTIGPLHSPVQKHVSEDNDEVRSLGSNLWKEDSSCLHWLDSKEPNYVSFGSIVTMTKEQLVEFAWGLANSDCAFLWILRPDIVVGESAVIPPEFLNEVGGRGLIASWCDQEKVLEHSSIGGFLTHCGWNSMLETISAGVPILCWPSPYIGEQQTVCWYACNKWGIGMEISHEVKREEVEKQVREVMEGEKGREMKEKAKELKRLAEEATSSPSGSSYSDFDKLVNQFQALNQILMKDVV